MDYSSSESEDEILVVSYNGGEGEVENWLPVSGLSDSEGSGEPEAVESQGNESLQEELGSDAMEEIVQEI